MRLFGLEITLRKAAVAAITSFPDGPNAWWPLFAQEPYAGAWQRNDPLPMENVIGNTTVYRCITLIAADIAKMRLKLMQEDSNGIGQEIDSPAFSGLLERPNHYQNNIQFFESWLFSKLVTGNTFILKGRDGRNVVNELHVLNPGRTRALEAPNGDVYYELRRDDLSGVNVESVIVPSSEIIHDRMNAIHHKLWGLSPIAAAHLPAAQAMRILKYSDQFFSRAARPSGVLTAPGLITDATAKRLKANWEENYTAGNVGRVAVLGDGLKFESMSQNAVDAELIGQLRLTDEKICTSFGVPAYKVGVQAAPAYDNIEALDQQYYSNCLQTQIESIEALLNAETGLELPDDYYVEFDLKGLVRMDTPRRTKAFADLVNAGILAINEARREFDYGPKDGGDVPRLQQQMIPIDAPNPSVAEARLLTGGPSAAPAQAPAANDGTAEQAAAALAEMRKGLMHV